jgi:hypothetical protein
MEMPEYNNPTAAPPAPVEGGNPTEEEDPAQSLINDLLDASPETLATMHALIDVALAVRASVPALPVLPSPAPNVLLSPVGLTWKVYGNDPIDASGGRSSVLTARHSAGKPEALAKAAFPQIAPAEAEAWIRGMPGADVWRDKKGGLKDACMADARVAARDIIKLGIEHGTKLRIWGCGMGMDRMVQCSMKTGWFNAESMRPATWAATPAHWEELGIRASPSVHPDGRCQSINLDSSSDGSGTYKVEIYEEGVFKTHFFLGVFPHPGSTGWGQAKLNEQYGAKFLRDLTAGTPLQTHVIKFNADEYK